MSSLFTGAASQRRSCMFLQETTMLVEMCPISTGTPRRLRPAGQHGEKQHPGHGSEGVRSLAGKHR